MLLGKLFRGYDERIHGPLELRFRRSVGNAIRNIVEKEKARRRNVPTVSISQEFSPGSVTAEELPARSVPDDEEKVVEGFRELVRRRLGDLALAVLDVRLEGGETKSLVGLPSLGSPGKWVIKKVVAGIKALAREFFRGDPDLLRRIERAMRAESETIGKRRERRWLGREWGLPREPAFDTSSWYDDLQDGFSDLHGREVSRSDE